MTMDSADNRFFIINLLNNFRSYNAEEEKSRLEIIEFVQSNKECFDNTFQKGHITGSALVVDTAFEYTLLTHHVKLEKWFQFGGHSDSDPNTLAVGLREATEESCLTSLKFVPGYVGIFDVDVHPIKETEKMPLHNHYDIRILLTADIKEAFTVTHESKDLKWVLLDNVAEYNTQPAFLRLVEKARKVKERL